MATVSQTNEATHGRVRRFGLWLGPAMFVGILALPTPATMRAAARLHFAPSSSVAAGRVSAQDRAVDASGTESAEEAAASAEIERHARMMLAAAAVTAWVACWWITVAVPIPVTSLLPLLLLPLVGVMPVEQAAAPYARSEVFLFMGGFIVALAIERWGLHRRIALSIVAVVGTGPATIVLGFMLASAALSMWISNTATALMMLPIGMAVLSAGDDPAWTQDARQRRNFAAALMLGIAYAASVGGIATPIGTPPNIAFQGQLARLFPDAPPISFGQWVILFVPLTALFLPIIWLVLVKITCPVSGQPMAAGRAVIRERRRQLGLMQTPERRVLIVFTATAALWITRTIPVGDHDLGWSFLLERLARAVSGGAALFMADYINDATVALAMAALLFVIPSGGREAPRGQRLMDWTTAEKLPWGILLLFGGGFSIAAGFRESGLSLWCGHAFAESGLTSPVGLVAGTCLVMTFVTEITSNTATTQVMLPILAGAGQSMGIHPLALMLPATISASCAFMMPVATPPNAIVFASGRVEMGHMVRTGLILNFIGVVIVAAVFFFLAAPLLDVNATVLPNWAR